MSDDSPPPPADPAALPKARKPKGPPPAVAPARVDRLKVALKANMARRKAQARGRAESDPTADSAQDSQE